MAGLQRENPPYWPGGIPAHIRCHPQPIPRQQLDDEIQGWLLFLDENTAPRPADASPEDDLYELRQRRRLLSDWASISQVDRDAYQTRGVAPPPLRRRSRRDWHPPPGCFKAGLFEDQTRVAVNAVNCIAPQPLSPRDRAVWTKLRILLYRLDGDEGALIDDGRASVCTPNPESAGRGLDPDREFLKWNYVENADFHRMCMTSTGTVVFYGTDGPRVLVDREALDTGRVLLCEFENNGQLEASCRVRPCILYEFWPLIENLGKPVRGVMERDIWKSRTYNGPYVST